MQRSARMGYSEAVVDFDEEVCLTHMLWLESA